MFDINLSSSVSNFDISLTTGAAPSGEVSVKISNVFTLYPIYVKIAGNFIQKTLLVKVGGVFT